MSEPVVTPIDVLRAVARKPRTAFSLTHGMRLHRSGTRKSLLRLLLDGLVTRDADGVYRVTPAGLDRLRTGPPGEPPSPPPDV